MKTERLNGLIVDTIDDCSGDILIRTACGKEFIFTHHQDCCESVGIYDSIGDLKVLEGKKLSSVTFDISNGIPEDVNLDPYDSYTWTEITFKTTHETVISRWIGESNGYYSENVDLDEIN